MVEAVVRGIVGLHQSCPPGPVSEMKTVATGTGFRIVPPPTARHARCLSKIKDPESAARRSFRCSVEPRAGRERRRVWPCPFRSLTRRGCRGYFMIRRLQVE